MAIKETTLTLVGEEGSGFLMHNIKHLIDPMDPIKKELSKLTGLRKKTDEVHAEIARLEFLASLYMNSDGVPCIPGRMLKAVLHNAAKKTKDGPKVRMGVLKVNDAVLVYDGPKDEDGLWGDGTTKYISKEAVRVQQSSTLRCRPLFTEWEAEVTVRYDDAILNERDVAQFFETGGLYVGIGDWRVEKGGDFGRFFVRAA